MTNMTTVGHGGTRVYEGMEGRFDDLKSQKKQIAQMRDDVENNPNLSDSERQEMLDDLDRAENSIDKALDYSTASGKYDTTSGNTRNDGDLGAVEAALGQAEASMNHVDLELQISSKASAGVSGPPRAAGLSGARTSSAPGASQGTSGAGGAGLSSGGGLGNMKFGGKSVNQMLDMMNRDPRALTQHLSSLSPEDKQMAMQMMTQRLQQINEMFSMMSNMMKSMHDTAKASINNMRV